MADYNNILDYLKSISISKLGLERTAELCERLGNPQDRFKIIHVAGTNGKGSFCTMLSAILRDSGYKVGGFSSPALTEVTDSFRINGNEISRDDFTEIMADIIPHCEDMDDKPTEFEVLTAFAFELFARRNCDIAVIECGMGGDTDSTNIISSPLLSVITNIALDHTAFLGDTIQEIACHKAGIIKPRRPVLYGGNNSEAWEIISASAEKNHSPIRVTRHSDMQNIKSDLCGIFADFQGLHIETRMTGTYQPYNIANVLTAVEMLRSEGLNIPENAVKSGLFSARLHGRFELISEKPVIIFDGSHNPDGIRQTAYSIRKYFDKKVVLLIGVMADKDYELYPKMLGKYIARVYTVKPDNPRALDSGILAETFADYSIEAVPSEILSDGVRFAVDYATENNLPLIALGSLYMYKDFIRSLNPRNLHG
ncbi:MAG: bifunctional folylpolyglutamate synthase/dihydrofolate synthase [Ruminococcus flavefaciens]|nr:bifunctional folylpolyglutamate synthase/dihydrofolate synthase [Ruminococcus flavefaciens]MCM1228976.1 bifunctional folylpolyglutamate synthase/dihydrofolate synthase [Ruminococcus flavefaciens]